MHCVFHYFLIQVLLDSRTFLALLRITFIGNEKFSLLNFKYFIYLSTQFLSSLQYVKRVDCAGTDPKKEDLAAARALRNYRGKIKGIRGVIVVLQTS